MGSLNPTAIPSTADYNKKHPYIIIRKTVLDKETVNSEDEFMKAMKNKELLSVERDEGTADIVPEKDVTIEKVYYKIGEDEEDITKIVETGNENKIKAL